MPYNVQLFLKIYQEKFKFKLLLILKGRMANVIVNRESFS